MHTVQFLDLISSMIVTDLFELYSKFLPTRFLPSMVNQNGLNLKTLFSSAFLLEFLDVSGGARETFV